MNYTKEMQYVDIVNILFQDHIEGCVMQPGEAERLSVTFLEKLPYNHLKDKLKFNSKTGKHEIETK